MGHGGVTWTVQRCRTAEGAVCFCRLFRDTGGQSLAYQWWDPEAASEEERRLVEAMVAKLPELAWEEVRELPAIRPHEDVGDTTAEDCRKALLALRGALHPDLLAEALSLLDDCKRDGSSQAYAAYREARRRLRAILFPEGTYARPAWEPKPEVPTEKPSPASGASGVP